MNNNDANASYCLTWNYNNDQEFCDGMLATRGDNLTITVSSAQVLAEFSVWIRGIIDSDVELLLFDDSLSVSLNLEADLTLNDVITALEEN